MKLNFFPQIKLGDSLTNPINKKTITAFFFSASVICGSISLTASDVSAQCTPNPNACQIADPNLPACIEPDTGKTGYVGKPYNEVIQLLMGKTVKREQTEVYLARLELLGMNKVPPGLTPSIYSGNPADGLNGAVKGNITPKDKNSPIHLCAVFSGTPTERNYQKDSVEIEANIYVKLIVLGEPAGGEFAPRGVNPIKFNYRIGVSEGSSLEDQIRSKLFALKLVPNSGNNILNVNFSLPMGADVDLVITDINGKEVMKENFPALDAGNHLHPIFINHLPSGVYNVQLKSLNTMVTEKFIR